MSETAPLQDTAQPRNEPDTHEVHADVASTRGDASTEPKVSFGQYQFSKSILTDLTKLRPPFTEIEGLDQEFGNKLDNSWKLHMLSGGSETGYDGALFSTEIEGTPHYFIYNQGTNNFRDLPSVAKLLNGEEPLHVAEARSFAEKAKSYIAEQHPGQDIPLIQSGYSLGAAVAIIASDSSQPVIAFESPGTKEILEKNGTYSPDLESRVLEVISPHANYVNSHLTHVGSVMRAGEKFLSANGKVSLKDFVRFGWDSHRISNIGRGLQSMESMTVTPASSLDHPREAFDSFVHYLRDNISEQASIGEQLLTVSATVINALWVDKLATRVLASSADRIASRLTPSELSGREQYNKLRTHPLVNKEASTRAKTREQEQEPEQQQQQDVLQDRQNDSVPSPTQPEAAPATAAKPDVSQHDTPARQTMPHDKAAPHDAATQPDTVEQATSSPTETAEPSTHEPEAGFAEKLRQQRQRAPSNSAAIG